MPLPAPSSPTFPRRRSRRSFRRRPPSTNTPPKTGAFRTDRNSQAKTPQVNNCFDSNTVNDNPSSGSFRFRSKNSSASASFRFRRSHSQKNKDTAYANCNANNNFDANTNGLSFAEASFGSLRFQSARNSTAQPRASTASAHGHIHSNASSPSLRFQTARSSAAQPPPSTSIPTQSHNPTPTSNNTTSQSTGSFRFRSSPIKAENAFRFKKSYKSKKSPHNAHSNPSAVSMPHSDACSLINRSLRTTCVRRGVLKILMEIDSLVQYAERDVSTVDIMAKRILGIHTQSMRDVHCEANDHIDFVAHSNVVVQKQLQAASVLQALRMRPDNSVVKKAKSVIKSARTLIDTQAAPDSNGNGNSVSNIKLCQMERTLYQAANDLVDVDTNVTVREQILELLVLTARKRAETNQHTPSSNISSYSSRASSASLSGQKVHNQQPQYERNISIGVHEPAEDHDDIDINISYDDIGIDIDYDNDNNSYNDEDDNDNSTEEKLEYVLKYQHQFQDWAPVTVKESFPVQERKKQPKHRKIQVHEEEEEEDPTSINIIHEKYSAEDTPNACTVITRSWKAYRLRSCSTIVQLKRLKTIRDYLTNSNMVMYLPSLKMADALTNEVLVLLGEVESMECESLKVLAEAYVTELVPLLSATRRSTSASIISRSVNGYRIRAEQLPVTLLRIETIVTGATKRNTEAGYREALKKLVAIEWRTSNSNIGINNNIVQRALKQAKQKLNGTRRIEELRTIARKSEAEQRDREAVEQKAQEWITWWTDYGIARSDLRLLLATLHRILPGCDYGNALEIDDPAKIRSIYRKALLHVHPDRLGRRKLEAFEQVMAQKIFVELQEAYNYFVENELNPGNCDD